MEWLKCHGTADGISKQDVIYSIYLYTRNGIVTAVQHPE